MPAHFRNGNAIRLLENGSAYFPALIAAIDAAQRSIYLESYIFAPDATGHAVADALARAAGRGVRTHVLVDGFGGRSFVRGLLAPLQSAGANVLIYRRELRLLTLRRHRLRRLHRKLAVIDGCVAFVGGINVADDDASLGGGHPHLDYAVRIEGPLLEDIHRSAQHVWRLVAWASLRRRLQHALEPGPCVAPVGHLRAAFVIRDTLSHRHDIENAYLAAIGGARREILIACAYFLPGKRFRHALIEAARRGVRVTLLLQGLSDHPLQLHATRALYPALLDAGIRLFEYHRSMLHAKVAVIDRHWATVGSSNIDPFSLLLAREANVVLEDPLFARHLRTSLLHACNHGARQLLATDWHRQPRLRRLGCWAAYGLTRLALGIAGYGRDD